MKPTIPTRESGFTLLELLLVIGVAALLLIGGITTYRLVSDGNKATESTRLLLTIRQESNTLAQQNGGNYTGINFSTAVSNTAEPLVVAGVLRDLQRDPYNGPMTVVGAPGSLTVTFDNISQSGCVKLVTAVNNPNEITGVGVGNAGTVPAASVFAFPVTAAQAATLCANATNAITWVFP